MWGQHCGSSTEEQVEGSLVACARRVHVLGGVLGDQTLGALGPVVSTPKLSVDERYSTVEEVFIVASR